VKRLVGYYRLSLEEDGKVCSNLIDTYYNQDLGARSLANAVKEVENEFSSKYTNINELISEDLNTGPF
jgi:ATP-dependent Clp protease ATP-binding subunit ClpA